MGKLTFVTRASLSVGALLLPLTAQAATLKTLHSFGGYLQGDGAQPSAALINVGGVLYGTSYIGGEWNYGTVFQFDPTTGRETVLHSFGAGKDGILPYGALVDAGGTLYGTTKNGGASGYGTVFSIDPTTGAESVLHSFALSTNDGAEPWAALINIGGILYGTTFEGGTSGYGTVFKINPATQVETVLYSLTGGSDGGSPLAALIKFGGSLYGTTSGGGTSGAGTVFKIDPVTGVETVLHSFAGGNDGLAPEAALLMIGGTLYGTTGGGGASDYGTVFEIDLATGSETVLHSFNGSIQGNNPRASLINVGPALYGMTVQGGTKGNGTAFRIDRVTGAETVLSSFNGASHGGNPDAALIDAGGLVYGTTSSGGASGNGTVFSLVP